MELVQNSDWILTKNAVMQKARYLWEELQSTQQELLASFEGVFPGEVIAVPAKISRGENYRGLPWLMLDYPRYFGKGNHFAVRSMFWWGRFFSITLHLSGVHQARYASKVSASLAKWQEGDYFICTGEDEWEHHFDQDNYTPTRAFDLAPFRQMVKERPFLKLAKQFPLSHWDFAAGALQVSFSEIMTVLAR